MRAADDDDVLATPGELDLTAHVNFTEIESAGHVAGLVTEFFGSQAAFLTRAIAAESRNATGPQELSPDERRQFMTLVHPDQLGERFKVLVQRRR